MGLTKPRASQIYNLDYKQSTRAVTTTNVTLTGGAPLVVDGATLSAKDRVLVTGQSTGSENGIYYVVSAGSGSNGTWARGSDANDTGEIDAGTVVMVTEGATYADTQWKLITDDPIIVGDTTMVFTQNYSANSISGGTSNVVVYSNANVTISSAGIPNVVIVSSTGTVTYGTASVTGNVTGSYFIGNGSQLTGIAGGGGTPGGANTYIQFNDSSTFGGTAGLTFDKTTNALATTGTVSATGTITGSSLVGSITSSQVTTALGYTPYNSTNPSGYTTNTGTVTSIAGTGSYNGLSLTGTVTSLGSLTFGGTPSGTWPISVSGSAATAATVTTAAQPNITSVGTLTSVSVSGSITGASLTVGTGTITGGNIVNSNANGVGNIGSATTYFNTVFAKATSAQYADLAEMYSADQLYAPGTVLEFGGEKEVTATTVTHSVKIAGIVSTHPSYLMNSALDCTNAVEVALVGRVPCQVVGTVHKGDRLTSSKIPGVAQALNSNLYEPGCIVGKALESYNSTEPGIIEVAVGRI